MYLVCNKNGGNCDLYIPVDCTPSHGKLAGLSDKADLSERKVTMKRLFIRNFIARYKNMD